MFQRILYYCRSTLIFLQSAKQSWFVLACGYFLLYYKSPIILDGINTSLYSIFSLITSLHIFSFKDSVAFDSVWSSVMFTCSMGRYDQKNLGCLWDRTHPSPYLFITFGTVVALPTITILCCYYKIFTYAKMCQAMVSWDIL